MSLAALLIMLASGLLFARGVAMEMLNSDPYQHYFGWMAVGVLGLLMARWFQHRKRGRRL